MGILGNFGSFYMLILIILLIVGLGMIGMKSAGFILGFGIKSDKSVNNKNDYRKNGGIVMNSWIRLALFSFVGIIVSMALLSFISPGGVFGGMAYNTSMQDHGITNYANMSMYQPYGNISMNIPTNNMQMSNDNYIMQMLQNMQQQLYMMQQRINILQNNSGGMGMM